MLWVQFDKILHEVIHDMVDFVMVGLAEVRKRVFFVLTKDNTQYNDKLSWNMVDLLSNNIRFTRINVILSGMMLLIASFFM